MNRILKAARRLEAQLQEAIKRRKEQKLVGKLNVIRRAGE